MTASARANPPTKNAIGTDVWERVWRHVPSDTKDDDALAREKRTPRWAAIISELKRTFGSIAGLRTVELGSGRGDVSVLLAQLGAEVTLVDYTQPALNLARERFERLGLRAKYVRADLLADVGDLRQAFDLSLSYGVIEHFKGYDRTRTIRAHRDVLRTGGLAVISVPNALCPTYRLWKAYLEYRGWWPYGMEIPYSPAELTHRARHAGFARTTLHASGLWQSIGDQWGKSILGRNTDWVTARSRFDHTIGFNLVLFASPTNPNDIRITPPRQNQT